MKWYHYITCFFAGMFLANVIPHLIHGVSGESFTTPFASPPGKGLSSPTVNVLWALINLIAGYVLYRVGKVNAGKWALLVFFVGAVVMCLLLSVSFNRP